MVCESAFLLRLAVRVVELVDEDCKVVAVDIGVSLETGVRVDSDRTEMLRECKIQRELRHLRKSSTFLRLRDEKFCFLPVKSCEVEFPCRPKAELEL